MVYYPLSEITENLYTPGYEFIEKDTGKFYTGDYFSTTDGKYFTGKTISINSKELLYTNKSEKSTVVSGFTNDAVIPTESDYEKGSFTRYVIKRVNSGSESILEVSEENFEKSKKNPLYNQVQFVWHITGPLYDDFSNMSYPIQGVVSKNMETIQSLEHKLPGLSEVFNNYSQFYKP